MLAGCAGISSQSNLQHSPTPSPTPVSQNATSDRVLVKTGAHGEMHQEFTITSTGVVQTANITLPTPDAVGPVPMASAKGLLFALDSGTSPAVDSFRTDFTSGVISPSLRTALGTGVSFLSVDPTGTFLYVNDAHDLPPGGYVSEMDVFRISSDGSLMRVPGAPFTMSGGPGGGCCLNLATPMVFTPDGTKAYAIIALSCPCHSAPSASWRVQPFQRNPATGEISMNPLQPFNPPEMLMPIWSQPAVLKNGKFLGFLTFDGFMVYSINPADGSLSQVPITSPVPPTSDQTPLGFVSATRDGEFVYMNDETAGKVFGFHVEASGALKPVPGSPYDVPSAFLLTVSTSDQFVFVATASSQTLMAFKRDPSTGALMLFGSAPINSPVDAMLNLN